MEYHSAMKRNKSESGIVSWMNLDPLSWSEGSQKEKNKHHILMHVYEILKKNEPTRNGLVDIVV